jgi:hypothetical protein
MNEYTIFKARWAELVRAADPQAVKALAEALRRIESTSRPKPSTFYLVASPAGVPAPTYQRSKTR